MASLVYVSIVPANLAPGQVRVVTRDGWRYAVCNVDGTYYVVDDTCTHDDGPLGEGQLDGCAIICPRHGARFDVRDGKVLSMPAAYPIRAYPTRVEAGQVQIGFTEAQRAREAKR